jgi:GNAT superfamily N-acetyltransferase|tara:strand:- start:1936 stop:2367 length:432 start_codon:yes stop_codon:yes gene_type:complete
MLTFKPDAQELLKSHWEEIALNKGKIALNPDWDVYQTLEDSGKLKIFTVRDDDKLIGYFVVLVGTGLHYKDHVFAVNDVLYLDQDCRKGRTGLKLIKFSEQCLKDDGVSVLSVNTKVHRPFDSLMEYLGFNLVERVYSKYIGD